jgi:hypothetical protein
MPEPEIAGARTDTTTSPHYPHGKRDRKDDVHWSLLTQTNEAADQLLVSRRRPRCRRDDQFIGSMLQSVDAGTDRT